MGRLLGGVEFAGEVAACALGEAFGAAVLHGAGFAFEDFPCVLIHRTRFGLEGFASGGLFGFLLSWHEREGQ